MVTTVSVYSLRPKDLPIVSTPLKWSEVQAALKAKGKASKKVLVFEADDVLKRVKKWGDLFAPVLTINRNYLYDFLVAAPAGRPVIQASPLAAARVVVAVGAGVADDRRTPPTSAVGG